MSDKIVKLNVHENPGLTLSERRERACEELDEFLYNLSNTYDLTIADMLGVIELVKFRAIKDSFNG